MCNNESVHTKKPNTMRRLRRRTKVVDERHAICKDGVIDLCDSDDGSSVGSSSSSSSRGGARRDGSAAAEARHGGAGSPPGGESIGGKSMRGQECAGARRRRRGGGRPRAVQSQASRCSPTLFSPTSSSPSASLRSSSNENDESGASAPTAIAASSLASGPASRLTVSEEDLREWRVNHERHSLDVLERFRARQRRMDDVDNGRGSVTGDSDGNSNNQSSGDENDDPVTLPTIDMLDSDAREMRCNLPGTSDPTVNRGNDLKRVSLGNKSPSDSDDDSRVACNDDESCHSLMYDAVHAFLRAEIELDETSRANETEQISEKNKPAAKAKAKEKQYSAKRPRRRAGGYLLEEGEERVWAREVIDTGMYHEAIIVHPQPSGVHTPMDGSYTFIRWLSTDATAWILDSNIKRKLSPRKRKPTNRYTDVVAKKPKLMDCKQDSDVLNEGGENAPEKSLPPKRSPVSIFYRN